MKQSHVTFLRSCAFNLCFFSWAFLCAVFFCPLFFMSPDDTRKSGRPWARGGLWLARVILGIHHEIRGREHISAEPILYAAKHQSAWDTLIFLTLMPRVAYVLKQSLLLLPFWGWYLWRMEMIAIDRSAGASSIKSLVKQSRTALAEKRPIVIFPEGTRMKVGAPPNYMPGVAALYSQLKVPVVPVALNSGMFWAKNAFTKHPGKIIIEFLPPIPPGLSREEFMQRLETAIETATHRLIQETKETSCALQEENRTSCAS